MERANISAETLRKQILAAEEDLAKLKKRLADTEAESLQNADLVDESQDTADDSSQKQTHKQWPLNLEEYQRYGRQMIVPSVGNLGKADFH